MYFENPDRCIIGTVGLPGERVFYWQIQSGGEILNLKMEKQQAAIIADELDELLDEVSLPNDPRKLTKPTGDLDALAMPIDDQLTVGGVGIFIENDLIRIEISAINNSSDDSDSVDPIIVVLPITKIREFTARTRAVVAAGRGNCPFCMQPLDQSGHICVRANGYRR
jgi:uncharacterized repeat protein (TIGR03847 family)